MTGGASCIGSNLSRKLPELEAGRFIILDDLSSSQCWNVPEALNVTFTHGSILNLVR